MTSRTFSAATLIVLAMIVPTNNAQAQCNPTWGLDMLPTIGLRGYIEVMTSCDIGEGASLYAAGFELSVNGINLNGIAVFNGTEWKPLSSGINGTVQAMLPFDDGSGPALYVGGLIVRAGGAPVMRLARWNGNTWYGIPGVPGPVSALGIHDDGKGPALYAACAVSTSGSPVTQIARWTGNSWIALGSSLGASIRALQSFDDGHGQSLFAAGYRVGGTGATFPIMFRWDGQSWLVNTNETEHPSDGTILSASFNDLQVFDDGSGPALYAAGRFSWAGQNPIRGIARWNGANWSAVGVGIEGSVQALSPIQDSLGYALCAAGSIRIPGSPTPNYVLRWSGSTWTPVAPNPPGDPSAIAVLDLGAGETLCAGLSNGPGVVRLEAGVWSSLATGHGGIYGSPGIERVFTQAIFDDGTGNALYVGGRFALAGGVQTPCLARWNGTQFSPVGTPGVGGIVTALRVFDDGSGPALYVGGNFQSAGNTPTSNIARWNGNTWSALGKGIGTASEYLWALEVFDDGSGPALYAAGAFETAGGQPARNIAKWNGKQWSPLGAGTDAQVYRLKSFTDQGGACLYTTGIFHTAGGVPAQGIARWNGKNWSAVGDGLTMPSDSGAGALAVHDDGSGPALYVSGWFTAAGGVPARNIARWNGRNWSAVGGGLGDFLAWDLATFDDGSGPALYAGGDFFTAGAASASKIARWDGSLWRSIGTGALDDPNLIDSNDALVYSLQPFDDGRGPALYFGGHFSAVDGHYFLNIAKLVHAAPDSPVVLDATPSQQVCVGLSTVLTVNAAGVPPLSFQWRRFNGNLVDGPGISGANTPQLTLSSAIPSFPGTYDCVITDANCQVASAIAYVSLASAPPVIGQQPVTQVIHAGSRASFQAGDFFFELRYQWRKNGAPISPSPRIQGAESNILTIYQATLSDTGLYDCVVTNGCGSTTTNPARLTVLGTAPPPAKPIGPIPADPG